MDSSLPYLIRSRRDISGLKLHNTGNVFGGISLYFGQQSNIIICPCKVNGLDIREIDSFKSGLFLPNVAILGHIPPHSSNGPINILLIILELLSSQFITSSPLIIVAFWTCWYTAATRIFMASEIKQLRLLLVDSNSHSNL